MAKKVHLTKAFSVALFKRHPQMNAYSKYFKYNKCTNLLVYDKELCKNIKEFGVKLVIFLKKNLIVKQCITSKYFIPFCLMSEIIRLFN